MRVGHPSHPTVLRVFILVQGHQLKRTTPRPSVAASSENHREEKEERWRKKEEQRKEREEKRGQRRTGGPPRDKGGDRG